MVSGMLVRGRLAEIIFGFVRRCECRIRGPNPSSPDPRGEESRSGPFVRGSLPPKAESCRFWTASKCWAAFFGREECGDSRPNLLGTEAATGPCLQLYETPLLSNEAGNGASKTLR